MAFDGVLPPPDSASFAGQAAISRSLACQSTPERLLQRYLSQGPQVPPPVGKSEWRFAQWSPFGRGQPSRRNCSVKTRTRPPPAGLSSMTTEQRTKRPPPSGLGAESGDETRGVGTIGSVRQPCRGVSRLACPEGGPAAALLSLRRGYKAAVPPPQSKKNCRSMSSIPSIRPMRSRRSLPSPRNSFWLLSELGSDARRRTGPRDYPRGRRSGLGTPSETMVVRSWSLYCRHPLNPLSNRR